MQALTLKPRQVYEVRPEHSHPRLSIMRVLHVRLCRWLDKASPEAIRKALTRCAMFLLFSLAVFVPQFLLGFLIAVFKWNSFKIPLFLAGLCSVLKLRAALRWIRRRKRTGNQHTFHDVPVGELASFLIEHGSFKRDVAMDKLALAQRQYAKIADELEKHDILTRGQDNARVLRPITLEQLVRQLRDKFPLVWDPERESWAERDGAFERWTLNREFQQRKLSEDTARKERKLERIEQKIEQAKIHPLFAQLHAYDA